MDKQQFHIRLFFLRSYLDKSTKMHVKDVHIRVANYSEKPRLKCTKKNSVNIQPLKL